MAAAYALDSTASTCTTTYLDGPASVKNRAPGPSLLLHEIAPPGYSLPLRRLPAQPTSGGPSLEVAY